MGDSAAYVQITKRWVRACSPESVLGHIVGSVGFDQGFRGLGGVGFLCNVVRGVCEVLEFITENILNKYFITTWVDLKSLFN